MVDARPLNVRWTATALADLDRFASFLHMLGSEHLALQIADAIKAKTRMIT